MWKSFLASLPAPTFLYKTSYLVVEVIEFNKCQLVMLSAENKIMEVTDTDPALVGKETNDYTKRQEVLNSGHIQRVMEAREGATKLGKK